MEYRKVMDIIAYYLSEFDKRAFNEFGFETQTKGLDEIAALFYNHSLPQPSSADT